MKKLTFIFALLLPSLLSAKEIVVASKLFPESVILAEIIKQSLEAEGFNVIHKKGLGGTRILWTALQTGEIDIYPDYTGTIRNEILRRHDLETLKKLRSELKGKGIYLGRPFGFNNTYILGMRNDFAHKLNIEKISDLIRHPDLKIGFSNEFMERADGWPGLKEAYSLPQYDVRGIEHALAYKALESGKIAITDLYSTDAEVDYYKLRTLRDDKNFFPEYKAVTLARDDLDRKAIKVLDELAGIISDSKMVALNSRAKIDKIPEALVAQEFLESELGVETVVQSNNLWQRLLRTSWEHILLVLISLSAAILISIPLGVLAVKNRLFGQIILGATGTLQTIPSLALFVFLIPLVGIGTPAALFALFLYSLLPIVRNTFTGIQSIPVNMQESATALGISSWFKLFKIEIPLASASILAGIKTAAIINIGVATLGAIIGAGGYGQPILTGIRLDDISIIMEGAVPAALLAFIVQGLFELLEIWFVPRGLRLKRAD